MANMVEGGKTPVESAAALEQLGYSLVIFPGGDRARHGAMPPQDFYTTLHARRHHAMRFRNRMFDFDALNSVIGTPEMLALGKTL